MSMPECDGCGNEITDSDLFCPHCAFKTEQAALWPATLPQIRVPQKWHSVYKRFDEKNPTGFDGWLLVFIILEAVMLLLTITGLIATFVEKLQYPFSINYIISLLLMCAWLIWHACCFLAIVTQKKYAVNAMRNFLFLSAILLGLHLFSGASHFLIGFINKPLRQPWLTFWVPSLTMYLPLFFGLAYNIIWYKYLSKSARVIKTWVLLHGPDSVSCVWFRQNCPAAEASHD